LNSLWLVIASLAAFLVAYRLYGAFLAARVAVLNDARLTPAHRLRDGVDYHPTRRLVLFGAHFAAIAGAGPLLGPVLAAQWGYLPGFTWIVLGACLAGGVHDFVVLLASVRQDGLSLPKIAAQLLGPVSGAIALVATLFVVIATLAGAAIAVVNALCDSPWGVFAILVTIPAALVTGLWMNKVRPGRMAEASWIGVSLVLLGVVLGAWLDESAWRRCLVLSKPQLSIILPIYGVIVSVLPVWVLLCPRGYLSSYMKIGVIVVLALGIVAACPVLKMPATTPFIHGDGPVVPGSVWPFVCIVIMCGALSGFHALVSSSTTPKMVDRESDIRAIGYGGMLVEGFVSVMALIAACSLEPGDYFKINVAVEKHARMVEMARDKYHLDLSPREFDRLQASTGKEKLAGKTAGAVTLAAGMAAIFARLPGMARLSAYWYHFIIMFEALFILTLLETGTRACRFIFEEAVRQFRPRRGSRRGPDWLLNVISSSLVCFLWGYLLYNGSIEDLWRMMGVANQLLAIIALALGTSYLLVHSPKRIYALTTAIPLVFVAVTVFTAGIELIGSWLVEMSHPVHDAAIAFNLKLMCVLTGTMMLLSALVLVQAARRWYGLLTKAAEPEAERDLVGAGQPRG
jgi:carbon starvation protein